MPRFAQQCEVLHKSGIQDGGLLGLRSIMVRSDLKALICRELHHTEGYVIRCCLRCTMPVCDACIVKDAFEKEEATYYNRRRHVCAECWDRRQHSVLQSDGSQSREQVSFAMRAESKELCQCSVHDGWLCSRCKVEQNSNLASKLEKCVTEPCESKPLDDQFGGRMCLWCGLPMLGRRSPGEARREYDSLHLRARAYSSCEPLEPVKEDGDLRIDDYHIRYPRRSVFLGREDSREALDSQRKLGPKPPLPYAFSAAILPTQDAKSNDNFKEETGLLQKMSRMLPLYKRSMNDNGQGLHTTMVKWRSPSTSLLIRRPKSVFDRQDEPQIVLYDGP